MGHVDFQSQKIEIQASAETVFNFLADLNNLQKIMPDQIINWQSDTEECSFDIKGMAHISLRKSFMEPYNLIRIVTKPGNPVELEFRGRIEKKEERLTYVWIELTAHLSPILKLMASDPLQNLIDIMAGRLREVIEVRA